MPIRRGSSVRRVTAGSPGGDELEVKGRGRDERRSSIFPNQVSAVIVRFDVAMP